MTPEPLSLQPAVERKIFIRCRGDEFHVEISPAVDDEPDLAAIFPTYRRARGWAGGLKLSRGWRIIDETCGVRA